MDTIPSICFAKICLVILTGSVAAQYDPRAPEPLPPPVGTLFLHGGGHVSHEQRQKFTDLAGGNNAKIIIIPTADVTTPNDPSRILDWRACNPSKVQLLHTGSHQEASRDSFSKSLEEATGVWFSGGKQGYLVSIYEGTPVIDRIKKLIDRGGVVGGTSAGAAIASTPMLIFDRTQVGFEFLPGTIIDQHFLAKGRLPRLLAALDSHPNYVGFGIDEATAMIVRGRKIEVIGDSSVTICFQRTKYHDQLVRTLKPGEQADLVSLRRFAHSRLQEPLQSKPIQPPKVTQGTMMLAGGGPLPKEILNRFVVASGGPNARIAYVPTNEAGEENREAAMLKDFLQSGAGEAVSIRARDRTMANSDSFCLPLQRATGVWFGGAKAWSLVDSYQNTLTHQSIHRILENGGAIGGSSGGATIIGDCLLRAHSLGDAGIFVEGYERGLGFLKGVAIDTHFTQKRRLEDLRKVHQQYPKLLGIGIDEGTAVVIQDLTAEVVGNGKVTLLMPAKDGIANEPREYRPSIRVNLNNGEVMR